MKWNLFLDDERFPSDKELNKFIIARTKKQAIDLIQKFNCCPVFISFDHDLGENEETGKDFANYLINRDLDENGNFIPNDFSFYVHSQNNIGKQNIEGILNNYLLFKKNNDKNKIKF